MLLEFEDHVGDVGEVLDGFPGPLVVPFPLDEVLRSAFGVESFIQNLFDLVKRFHLLLGTAHGKVKH